jgi:hypothetical protein
MATVEFRYDPKNTAWFTANAAMILKAGEPAYHDTTGLFKLGDGVTALSALSFLPIVSSSTPTLQQVLTAGQVATTTIETTGFIKTGGTFGQFLKADGSVDANYYLTYSDISASTPLNYSNLTGVFSINQSSALSDGYLSSTDWSTFNGKQNTISLTTNNSSGASTLIANVLNVPTYTLAGLGGTTLAAVNAQNLSVFAATTSSQLAGVISDETGSGSLVFGTSPTFTTNITTPLINGTSGTLQIGTTDLVNIGNKTTTSQRIVRIGQDTAWVDIGSLIGTPSAAALYLNQSTPSGANYTIMDDTSSLFINGRASNSIYLQIAGTNIVRFGTGFQIHTPTVKTSGSVTDFTFTVPNNTNQTLGTNIPNFRVTGANKQWATGALATQYFNHFTANTVSFVGASTATHVANFRVDAPIQGTNATATNLYAIDCGGHQFIANSVGVPVNNPTGGGILYVEAGALKYRGSSGTVTTLGLA